MCACVCVFVCDDYDHTTAHLADYDLSSFCTDPQTDEDYERMETAGPWCGGREANRFFHYICLITGKKIHRECLGAPGAGKMALLSPLVTALLLKCFCPFRMYFCRSCSFPLSVCYLCVFLCVVDVFIIDICCMSLIEARCRSKYIYGSPICIQTDEDMLC